MPEIKHQFTGGKMNLDLDERLVPNGEYREAFNIQVSSSEGSNVGVLQNLLSNNKVSGQNYTVNNPDKKEITYECIGSISDEKNDALYWFVKPKWHVLSNVVDFFKPLFGSPQQDLWPTDQLWEWQAIPSAHLIGGGHYWGVKTTIGQDMIIEYKSGEVLPVLVDQFEVICGNWKSEWSLPEYLSPHPSYTNGEILIRVDQLAYTAVEVGWSFAGYTKGNDVVGTNSFFIPMDDIYITSKKRVGSKYWIGLKSIIDGVSGSVNTSFNAFYMDIQNFGSGPAGFVKAFYFKNLNPAANFRRVNHITGVNILDNMMFWTDGYDEPKKINITRSLEGTNSSASLPTYLINESRDIDNTTWAKRVRLTKEHITVIKKSPNNPPVLGLVTGREVSWNVFEDAGGTDRVWFESYSGIFTTGAPNPVTQTDDVVWVDMNGNGTQNTNAQDLGSIIPGSEFQLNITKNTLGHSTITTADWLDFKWDIGDTVVLKEFDETNTDQPSLPLTDYTIKGQIVAMSNPVRALSTPFNTLSITIKASGVDGTPPIVDDLVNDTGELQWVIDKHDEEKNIFEFKYPRFGYRYKYEDGEYSHFSPFTQPAFTPGGFDYHPKKGWNLGMANRIEYIVLKNFKPDDIPLDVVEVDILYKDDSSPIVYVVDTIKADAQRDIQSASWATNHPVDIPFPMNYWELNAYKITDEQIKYVLPENQLLRIYDNVPRRALAQEITGNRVVYGNYLQNFDLFGEEHGDPSFNPSIYHDTMDSSATEYALSYGTPQNIGGYNMTKKSIKSLREYQLGVVFIDEFGRETPVLSNRSSTFKIAKNLSDKTNRLVVGTRFGPPDGNFAPMKYFKFFIKETSGEYYNLAMDRWYDAQDGNVWMSFPSSDRNKLDIDDFLILKKSAESNIAVTGAPGRYKVIAIENEAPDYIKYTYTLMDYRTHAGSVFNTGMLEVPRSGFSTFELNFSEFYNTSASDLHDQFKNKGDDDFYVQFELSGELSKKYKISSITSDIIFDGTTGVPSNLNSAKYYLKTSQTMGTDVNIILDDQQNIAPTSVVLNAKMRIFKAKPENKPEFDGRFFVKIFGDDIFEQHIKSAYNPLTDVDYVIGPSIKFYYMNDEHHLMYEGGIKALSGDWKDSGGNSYHAGTGFPREGEIDQYMYRLYSDYPGGGTQNWNDTNNTQASFANHVMENAYSASRYIGYQHNGRDIKLGLRHFAAFFRNYSHAGHGVDSKGAANNGATNYEIKHSNIKDTDGWVGNWIGGNPTSATPPMDNFSWIYKFDYGTSGDDSKWREEYNRYTTVPHKSFDPIMYLHNKMYHSVAQGYSFDTSNVYPFSWPMGPLSLLPTTPTDPPYSIPLADLLWDTWWRTKGYKKKSDNKARDTEVWYINHGRFAGKEYYTNNKQWNSLYGPGQGFGFKPWSSTITLDLTLGGLWGEPIASMDAQSGMNDPGFFDIGKSNGNPSYQDGTTVAIVNQLKPGSYCQFKEDPTGAIYQVISVKENNLYNYSRHSKGDSNQGGWLLGEIMNEPSYVHHDQGLSGLRYMITGPAFVDGLYWYDGNGPGNRWVGDFWGGEDTLIWYDFNSFGAFYEPEFNSIGLYCTKWDGDYIEPEQGYISWTKNNSHGSQLSCNYSKTWRLTLVNTDEANPNMIQWDPTGSNSSNFGPIPNGVSINITVDVGPTATEADLTSGTYGFYTDSITDSNNNILQLGMILTKHDASGVGNDVNFSDTIFSTSDHHSHLFLQIVGITPDSTYDPDGYFVELGGYIRPLTVNDTYPINPTPATVLTFKQAKMNGYSPNSVNKISANMSYSPDFDTGTTGGALDAVGYTLQFLIPEEDGEVPLSENPAIWETEPEDGPDLDIYYEASPRIPIKLSQDTANDWIPTRYHNNPDLANVTYSGLINQAIHNPYGSYENSIIIAPLGGTAFLTQPHLVSFIWTDPSVRKDEFEIVHVDGDILTLRCDKWNLIDAWILSAEGTGNQGLIPDPYDKKIYIRRPDGLIFGTKILAHNIATTNVRTDGVATNITQIGGLEPYVDWSDVNFGKGRENCFRIRIDRNMYGSNASGTRPNSLIHLNWHNCYSFGNGVESNRIRDNFNTPFISNGVRVSTIFADYSQEDRKYGLIYSGIYNSTSGINNLNQFVMAEKITKEVNPIYGSIQKLHSRDTDLVTLCEDKILKILANKDAVYNADSNPQLTANLNVLGQTIPFVGEFGISRNPESFASENYRVYFTDKIRGAVLRLSRDGLTPISDAGMKDWFKDNLKLSDKLVGSYDDKKQEYNIALRAEGVATWPIEGYQYDNITGIVASYDEKVKGWMSFKSFSEMESGVSMANDYYTFKDGIMWKHHEDPGASGGYNVFYGYEYPSLVNVLLNDEPSVVKSFKTIGYEGSKAHVGSRESGSGTYHDFYQQDGWYVKEMSTNLEDGSLTTFIEKEDKWFSEVKGGIARITSPGGMDISFDTNSFANQGIGKVEFSDVTPVVPIDPVTEVNE